MESRRLILRPSEFSDCALFAEWESREEVSEFFTMDEGRGYETIVKEFINYSDDPTKEMYTIISKEENKPIGRIYLSRIDKCEDSLDLTRIYIADPQKRNKGLGEESLRLILEYAFLSLHMERVTIDHFRENKHAANLYKKIGFTDEGVMRHSGKKNGKYVDLCLMSMLRAEYYEKLHDQ